VGGGTGRGRRPAARRLAVRTWGLRARSDGGRHRATYFWLGLAAIAVALVSPLDAAASALASAHMVQHLLLTLVAAPLLALSRPGATLLRGGPRRVRRAVGRWRGRLQLTPRRLARLGHPVLLWLCYVATLWFWHASVTYDAALASEPVHATSHLTYLLTGVLFWGLLVRSARDGDPSPGLGLLLAFGAAMQGVFLSALLTFAAEPWYAGYIGTTTPWGLDQLTDQQLAGAIMWLPGGLVYLGSALALFVAWLREGGVEAGSTGVVQTAAGAPPTQT
jgi:putative membrane protein